MGAEARSNMTGTAEDRLSGAEGRKHPTRWKNLSGWWIAFGVSFIVFPWLVMGPLGHFLENPAVRLLVFAGISSGSAALLRKARQETSWGVGLLWSVICGAVVYQAASFLRDLSTSPFSLGWSEASRYYYASLFFARRIYGMNLPPSVLHPTRYLMQAVPFLLPVSPLWLHRLWQVLLWLGFTLGTAFLLARRLKLVKWQPIPWMVFVLWAFLFLFQGPVYYHLTIMVMMVLAGYDRRSPLRSWLVILLASAWAGVSRVNWVPVPGMLAAAIYFLEEQVDGKALWRYLLPPAAWTVIGSGLALFVQQVYIIGSGNPPDQFQSSLSSDLLWYRLLPNRTFPLGILPAILLVSMPLGLVILERLWTLRGRLHWIRILALLGILIVLLSGGLLVSVKIGGGSNLHNLDAYLALLLVIGSGFYFGQFHLEDGELAQETSLGRLPGLVGLAVLVPVYFSITAGGPLVFHDSGADQQALQTLNQLVQSAVQNGGEVLFISQRQLLTFHILQDVPLVPEDEQVFLMEMVMSRNQPYLQAFHQDIENHRFALIISDPLVVQYQGRWHSFGEENDIFVSSVSEPVLCDYEPIANLKEVNVQVLAPKAKTCR